MRLNGASISSNAVAPICDSCLRAGAKASDGRVHCLKYGWVNKRLSCSACLRPQGYRPTVQRRKGASPQEAPKPRKTRPIKS